MEAPMGIFRKICIICLLGIVFLSGAPGLSAEAYQGVPDAVVATYLLSMRAAPATRAAVVARLPRGTRLTLDGRNRDSMWVHAIAETGAVGWVSRPYLSIRRTLVISSLPIMDANAATSGGGQGGSTGGNTGSQPTSPTRAAPPPPVSGSTRGGFELGGQVQDLNGGTIAAMQRAHMRWVKRQAHA